MKRQITIVCISLLIVCSAFPQSSQINENNEITSNIQLLESWFQAQMDYRNLPGMSIGSVYDQELIYAKGFGYSDLKTKKSATPQTIYRIASITKTFTATALLQLRYDGTLDCKF